MLRVRPSAFLPWILFAASALEQEPTPTEPQPAPEVPSAQEPTQPAAGETKTERSSKRGITAEFVASAYDDAKAAVVEVLGAKADSLPPLVLSKPEDLAAAVAAENLPIMLQREPDETKAKALADQVGGGIATGAYAKYSWSRKETLVVPETWEMQARMLKDPALVGPEVARAVLVHELCHALADARFDFTRLLKDCDTVDATQALNAVMEGHAQFLTRRVCAKKGWTKGFETFTKAIGALPALKLDAATQFRVEAESAALRATYHDGEAFAAAVVAARPEKGEEDMFLSPPRDLDSVLHPEWYLDPSKRPASRYAFAAALDAFDASFDAKVWTAQRNDVGGKQLTGSLSAMPKEEVEALLGKLRSATITQLHPTASPQSKIAYLIALEFESEEWARKWIAMSGRISDHKDDTMDKGVLRITGSKTTAIEQDGIFGLLQEKKMKNGRFAFEVSTIDACNGPVVLESLYSGDPPTAEAHVALVKELLAKVKKR